MAKKIALVTGGIGGIGSEICKALFDQGRFVVAGHLPQELEQAEDWLKNMKKAGYEVDIAAGDVGSFESAGKMIAAIKQKYGPIEILVNCAGITRDATLKKMEPEQWEAVINTNLNSVYNVTKHVLDGMLETGFGRIVNMSSVNGQRGQFGQTNYSAAKAGLHGFTMALSYETARKGITVNSVSPGYVATPMTKAIDPDVLEQIVGQVPMQRMGEPSEIAHAVAFLTDDNSAYITGANLPVNGGLFTSF
ncbi:MAG: acetoacetyl-CoA reductase [Porticoccaceae bacterium]